MSASVKIYNLPEATVPDPLDYFPISTYDETRKISFDNLVTAIDANARPAIFSFVSNDYVNVHSVTSGSRMFHPGNSIFYSVGTGSSSLILGNDSRLTNTRTPISHTHSLSEINTGSNVILFSASLGIPNGIAPLNGLGKINSIYIPSQSLLSNASQISASNLSVLIPSPTSVQDALGKLSNASFIFINSSSANVVGTNTVQGALAQKLSTSGGTTTGMLTVNGGLRVGASDIWVVSSNIGIGLTIPSSKLDVAGVISNDGNINVRRTNGVSDGGGITFYRASDNTADWRINQFSSRIRFSNSGGEKACIDSIGRLGIGTASPTAKLEVAGTSGVDGIKFPDGTLQTTAFTNVIRPYGYAFLNGLGHATHFKLRIGIYMFGANPDIAMIASKATPAGGYSSIWNNDENDPNWFKDYSYYFEFCDDGGSDLGAGAYDADGVGGAFPVAGKIRTIDWDTIGSSINWTVNKSAANTEPTAQSVVNVGARTIYNDNNVGGKHIRRIVQFIPSGGNGIRNSYDTTHGVAGIPSGVITRSWTFPLVGFGCNYTKSTNPVLNTNIPTGASISDVTFSTNGGGICFNITLPA